MEYKPSGQGILVSFDAQWRKSDNRRIDDSKLRKDFENMVKRDLEQQYPDMYIQAFPYGENNAAHSIYVELRGQKNLNGMMEIHTPYHSYTTLAWDAVNNSIKLRFYDYLGSGIRPMHISNLQVSNAQLDKVTKAGK